MTFPSDLLSFLTAVPTIHPFPSYCRRILHKSKYEELREIDDWDVIPKKGFVIHGNSLLAFNIGGRDSSLILASSTESSSFFISPSPSNPTIPIQSIGNPSPFFWAGNDLRAIGEVIVRDSEGAISSQLFDSQTAIATISTTTPFGVWSSDLASAASEGRYPPAVLGIPGISISNYIAESCGVPEDALLDYNLELVDAQPPQVVGADNSLIRGPGLDWLVGTFATIQAFLKMTVKDQNMRILVISGDLSAPWIEDVIARVIAGPVGPFYAKSLFVNVQAVDGRQPSLKNNVRTIGIGQGVAIVTTPSRIVTDLSARYSINHAGEKIGVNVRALSEKVKLGNPHVRTIGSIVGGNLGVSAVDIGVPVLGRGSVRLTAAIADVEALTRLLTELGENFDEHRVLL